MPKIPKAEIIAATISCEIKITETVSAGLILSIPSITKAVIMRSEPAGDYIHVIMPMNY